MNRLAAILQAEGLEIHRPSWGGLQVIGSERRILVTVHPMGDLMVVKLGLNIARYHIPKPWKLRKIVELIKMGVRYGS